MTYRPITPGQRDLSSLARPSGGFAMVAIDQREALRTMFERHSGGRPVGDETLTQFKVSAAQVLSPHASAILVDKHLGFDAVVDSAAIAPGCGLIAAVDHFVPGHGEHIGRSVVDDTVDPAEMAARGATALKQLIVYRPDGSAGERAEIVGEFLERCHRHDMISILEPVARPPVDGRTWNRDEMVVAAAEELGSAGADLYKAEIPLGKEGSDDELRRWCGRLDEAITSPWVVLSTGVPPERFPHALEIACSAGAAGFLAGRAVWAPVIGSVHLDQALGDVSVPRLQELTQIVDAAMTAGPT
nr:hypothetical protein [Phytoactinopolyspora halophila]